MGDDTAPFDEYLQELADSVSDVPSADGESIPSLVDPDNGRSDSEWREIVLDNLIEAAEELEDHGYLDLADQANGLYQEAGAQMHQVDGSAEEMIDWARSELAEMYHTPDDGFDPRALTPGFEKPPEMVKSDLLMDFLEEFSDGWDHDTDECDVCQSLEHDGGQR